MVRNQSLVQVVDNSGVLLVKVLKPLGKTSRCFVKIGGFFVGVVISVSKKKVGKISFRKGAIVKALLVRSNKECCYHKKITGFFIKENIGGNSAVIVQVKANNNIEILGNRFFGAIPREVFKVGISTGNYSNRSQFV